jgi:glycosyltransferase involved in cell wall biosynthesis
MTMAQGSGTALFAHSLCRAVERCGASSKMLSMPSGSSNYKELLFQRLWFNQGLIGNPDLAEADKIIALDYDGFAYPRNDHQLFICSARALFADIALTEPEPFKTMLELQAFYEQKNMQQADYVTTPSHYAASQLVKFYQLPEDKIKVIPNAIDLTEWDSLSNDEPQNSHPTLLVVCKLYPRKSVDTVIKALPQILSNYPDLELRIVGNGFEWQRYHDLAEQLGVDENITWLGDISDRARIVAEFNQCHVFIHPSIQETFGNVCLEAMAAVRPLVLAKAASLEEIADQSCAALTFEPGQPDSLAEQVIYLLSDQLVSEELAHNGRKHVESFSWEQVAQSYLSLK